MNLRQEVTMLATVANDVTDVACHLVSSAQSSPWGFLHGQE